MKRTSHMSVMIAEYDRSTRNVHRFLLKIAGYSTIEALDAPTAIQVLRTHPVGMVVLLDWDMPQAECMRILRGISRVPGVAGRHRFVLLSNAPESLHSRLLTLPASISITALRKPAKHTDLLLAVGEAAQTVPLPASDETQAL